MEIYEYPNADKILEYMYVVGVESLKKLMLQRVACMRAHYLTTRIRLCG
jgi:hypothetical protein